MRPPDPVALTQALVRCASVTPQEAGVFGPLRAALEPLGFSCQRLVFGPTPESPAVANLFARLGDRPPVLLFSGHTDVVPAGAPETWSVDPFAGEIREGRLFGRGAADMKSAIAAFIAAIGRVLADRGRIPGSIVLFLTNDEEGPAVLGTRALVEWFVAGGGRFDAAIVGEPTSEARVGDTIKIGRRGSLTGYLTALGRQGHVAYPERAENAAHGILRLLERLIDPPLDAGSEHFAPSTLQITTIDVGNPATNVVPARARATFNVRYNDRHTPASLVQLLRDRLDRAKVRYELAVSCAAEPFLTPPGPFSDLVAEAVWRVQGIRPCLSTSGGTSDARFLAAYAPVIELGIVGPSMHQSDEHVAVSDIEILTTVYRTVIELFFERWRC